MARVTRSRKLAIAEDNTALESPISFPANQKESPLFELPNEHNTMPSIEDETVDAELKSLKAAYRKAIGVGNKGKRTRGKKKAQQEVQQEPQQDDSTPQVAIEEEMLAVKPATKIKKSKKDVELEDNQNHSVPASEDNLQYSGELALEVDTNKTATHIEETQKYLGRTTRQRIAKSHPERTFADNGSPIAASNLNEAVATEQDEKPSRHDTLPNVDILIAPSNYDHSVKNTPIKGRNRSPAKAAAKTLEEVELEIAELETTRSASHSDDSFVEQITCRSPAKPVSRIEDSVEALDQLEEALEALDQAALAEQIVSPEKQRHRTNSRMGTTNPKPSRENATKSIMSSKAATMRVKPTVPRASVIKRARSTIFDSTSSSISQEAVKPQPPNKGPVKRPISLLPPKEPVKSSKPPTLPSKFELPGEAVARRLKEKREAREAQRESSEECLRSVSGSTVRSTKPPTTSKFELPGELISRRKREAHEARLKAQQEEDRKRREFKAKPIRQSIVPMVPRDTVASRARQSRIGVENMDGGNLTVSKRSSFIGAPRPSITQTILANTSVTRSPGPVIERKASTKIAGLSMTGLSVHRSVSSSDVQAQRQRAREIYNRDMKLTEDMEREKKEREAAAKRSREEAAERGRQASRDWAEKARARKLAEGDKGMSAGYGPGGQMGLRG